MVTVLAIDQGTSGTKAVVVDGGRQGARARRGAGRAGLPRRRRRRAVDPQALLDSVLSTGRRAAAAAGVPLDAVALANQGETVLAWDRADGRPLGPAVVWQDRALRAAVRRARRARRPRSRAAPGWSSTRTSRRRSCAGCATTSPATASSRRRTPGSSTGCAARSSRTPRRRAGRCCSSSTRSPGTPSCSTSSASPASRCRTSSPPTPSSARRRRSGRRCRSPGSSWTSRRRSSRRAASSPGPRSAPTAPAPSCWRRPGPLRVRSTAGLTTSVAWTLRGETSYCLDGQVYTAASAVRWLTDLGLLDGAAGARRGRRARQRGRALRARARRARRTVLGAGRDGVAHRDDPEHRPAGTSCGRCVRGRGGAGRRARRRRRPRTSAGRWHGCGSTAG